jgi:hypothetical protein
MDIWFILWQFGIFFRFGILYQEKSGIPGTQPPNERLIRGRCYDHNFLRFLPIFSEKIAFFSKTNVMIKFLHKLA